MNTTDMLARAELEGLAARYAAACDTRDVDTYVELFAPNGRVRVFNPSDAELASFDFAGRDELAGIPRGLARYDRTFHFLGNTSYEITPSGATGEVYCVAHHLTVSREGAMDYVMLIRYHDTYGELDGSWRFEERRVLVDWTETRPAVQGPAPR